MSSKQQNIDKGYELSYRKLSYRRKFIRTLWMIPFAIAAVIMLFLTNTEYMFALLMTMLLIVIFVIQLVYTYKKYKACITDTEQRG
jgi:hypothetical protein